MGTLRTLVIPVNILLYIKSVSLSPQLSLSCRYPERIMKTSDFVLRSLWYKPELQHFLASLGFYEVGQSLLFNKTEGNQVLLKSTLVIISTMLGKS